ncbi:hypothetical protein [Burkholderia ubonensis]|nr:hypothetical protein [Burkholderia ubonensis]
MSVKLNVALWGYGIFTIVLVAAVTILSSLVLIMNRLSGEIDSLVKENNLAIPVMHNELQEYVLTLRDSKSGVAGIENRLVNSASVLVMKQHIQKFAENNRQLYTDIQYLHRVWRPFRSIILHDPAINSAYTTDSSTDYTGINLYAIGCQKYHQASYFFSMPPNFPLGYKSPYSIATKSLTDAAGQNFSWPPPSKTIPWMCDKDSARSALEITLPLLRVGTVNKKDIEKPPTPEPDVQEGFIKISVYQDIRAIALILHNEVTTFANTVSGFILPILYAALGASASIFRRLRKKSTTSTSENTYENFPRGGQFVTASIIGTVIGLFGNLFHIGVEFSPLAIAFVAGYASDAFFELIDRIVKTMISGGST